MSKKGWLFFLLLLATLSAAAQSTRVRGMVKDADTGEPLPFASVYFDGTSIGISTDLEGRYSLETRSPEARTLTVHMMGYLSASVDVNQGSYMEINFSLQPDPKQLAAAFVKPDDHYIKSILQQLDAARSLHDPDNAPDWTSRLYTKIELDATNMDELFSKGVLGRNLGFVRNYSDTSSVTGQPCIPAMISENVSDLYHSQHPFFNREVMRASRISGLEKEQDNVLRQFTGQYLLSADFYKRTIPVINLNLPNPAAYGTSALYYNYYLVDSLQVDGRKTYVLRFHPKALVTSPAFDGEMQIDAEDFGIRSVSARLSPDSNVNWFRHINFDVRNRRLDDGRWFNADEYLVADLAISGSDASRLVAFLVNRHIHYDTPVFGPVRDADALSADVPVVMRDVATGDEAYWAAVRPYPLSRREQGIYDMVNQVQQQPIYTWSYGTIRAITVNHIQTPGEYFEFGPWTNFVAYNDSEGFRMLVGGRTMKNFSQKVRLGGYVALGFKDLTPKWNFTTEFIFRRETTRKLSLQVQKDYFQFGGGSGIFAPRNMFTSLFSRDHTNRQNMTLLCSVKYEHEFHPQFNTALELQHYRVWGSEVVPFVKPDGTLLPSFSVNQAHLNLRFSGPDERVTRNFFNKTYMFSQYPVLNIDLTGAVKGLLPDDVGFLRTCATLDWKTPSHALGFGRTSLEAGAVFGSVPFQLLKLHEANPGFLHDRSAAACMNYYEFLSDRWLSAYYEHNFGGFFLGKIPYVKELDLREMATVRFAWGTLTEANRTNAPLQLPAGAKTLETPYVEVGVGISNILRILRVDCFWRLTHRQEENVRNFAFNIGVNFDF